MHTFIARLTVLSALSVSAYAEVPQFPDPTILPPDTSVTSGSNLGTADTYVYPPASATSTTTGNSAAGIYVYPPADTSDTTNTVTSTAVSPTATYGYTYPQTQGVSGWGNSYNHTQPYYHNPAQYFPNPMLTPPTPPVPPMLMPTIPNFTWPNMRYGYRNTTPYSWTGNTANTQTTAQTSAAQTSNTQQIDTLNQNLSSLRQQQNELENKTQETLSAQERIIADLRKQLKATSQDKGSLESQLTALKGELAESVKKAELDSCKAEKDELTSKLTDMDQKVSAIAEVSQQFAQLRQNFATLETEKQQLVSALEHETKDTDKDGIADDADLCPDTAANTAVNQVGCSKTENINLKGVTFETGSAVLTATSLPILDEAAATLKKYPDLKIEVGGHTDSSGDKIANEKLSQSRAEAVMKYLVEQGTQAELLSAKGYGSSTPLADNATPDGKAQNRRVELKILP